MLESVLGKCSVVSLDVHFEVLVKTIFSQETENCSCIEIILMLCRLLWLWLDVEITCVAL